VGFDLKRGSGASIWGPRGRIDRHDRGGLQFGIRILEQLVCTVEGGLPRSTVNHNNLRNLDLVDVDAIAGPRSSLYCRIVEKGKHGSSHLPPETATSRTRRRQDKIGKSSRATQSRLLPCLSPLTIVIIILSRQALGLCDTAPSVSLTNLLKSISKYDS